MKKSIIALFSLLILAACSEKKSEQNLEITGNIKGLKKGTLYIKKLQDTTLILLDSIVISGNSQFKSSMNIESPEMLYLFLDRGETNTIDNSLMFFAEPGKINIDTDLVTFYAKAKITGSKNHDLYEEFKKVKSRFTDQELELTQERLTALKDNKAFSQEEKFNTIVKRKYLYAINFAVNNKEHEVAPYIALSEIYDANVKYLDTIRQTMSPKVTESKYGKLLTEYVAERQKEEAGQ